MCMQRPTRGSWGRFVLPQSVRRDTGASGRVKNQQGVCRIPIIAREGLGVCRDQQEVAWDILKCQGTSEVTQEHLKVS